MNARTSLETFFLSLPDSALGLWEPLIPLVKESAAFARLVVRGDSAPVHLGQIVLKGGEMRLSLDPLRPMPVAPELAVRLPL